jgi:hypothetical protein
MNIKRIIQKIQDRQLMLEISKISNTEMSFLTEAKKVKHKLTHKASADTKGKLHELLVGYHLKGGTHMSMHPDKTGESPKQVHDRLKESIHPKEYKTIYKRSKKAASHLYHEHVKKHGEVFDVHWTSQPGDIHRSTGVHSSQKEDASDLMIHTRSGRKITHHGVSLKVSDNPSHHVPVSNPGMKSTYGGEKILSAHKRRIYKKFPQLKGKSIKQQREYVKNHPKVHERIKHENTKTLSRVTEHLYTKLKGMSHKDLVSHIKTHVLQANKTPLQKLGHQHIRHVTYIQGGKQKHHAIDPSTHWHGIFKNTGKITVERSGSTINFKHKDKIFASHRMKFVSQSNPQSGIKGSGNSAGSHGKQKSTNKTKEKVKRVSRKVISRRKSKKK